MESAAVTGASPRGASANARVGVAVAAITAAIVLIAVGSNATWFTVPLPRSTGDWAGPSRSEQPIAVDAPELALPDAVDRTDERSTDHTWIRWLGGTLGVITVALAIWYGVRALRRMTVRFSLDRNQATTTEAEHAADSTPPERVVAMADDLIERLHAHGDPRIAVQQAYAEAETGFGYRGLHRRAAETPLAYLARVFGNRADTAEPAGRLTSLFQVARFSDEPITAQMRDDAIDALREIRRVYARSGKPIGGRRAP